MKENKLISYLIPIIAVVIIAECIFLVASLSKRERRVWPLPREVIQSEVEVVKEGIVAAITSDKAETAVGMVVPVRVELSSLKDYAIDAIDLYIKYDPKMVEISSLAFGEAELKPTYSKVSKEKGLVVANILISKAEGYQLKAGSKVAVMSFNTKIKGRGGVSLEVSQGEDKTSRSIIVENASSREIELMSSNLEFDVLE
jgi:hypothetical protein